MRVSVVVPNYNHARFLRRRIESILNQTHHDIEVIILDDCSTDESTAVIEGYLGDSRVSFFKNSHNSGSTFKQWNLGVQRARGELIWISESDDVAAVDFLEKLVPLFKDTSVIYAFSQSLVIDEAGREVGTMADHTNSLDATRWGSDFIADGVSECATYLLHQNTVPNASAVVFRRASFLRIGGAPENMRLAGDWWVWVRLAMEGRIAFCAEPLNYFRRHRGTVRARGISTDDYWRERELVQALIFSRCEVLPAGRRRLAASLANEWATWAWNVVCQMRLREIWALAHFLLSTLKLSPGAAIRALLAKIQRVTRRFYRRM
jgi:glycosyltransferase involved in cell wall biosynthesis